MNNLVCDYRLGQSLWSLAKMYNTTANTIKRRLSKLGVQTRNRKEQCILDGKKRRAKVNSQYFHVMDAPEKWYILGLLFADGSNTTRGHIALCLKDVDILEDVAKRISYSGRVKQYQRNFFSLQWCDSIMSSRLFDLGCIPNKSAYLIFPNISEQYVSHFMRGYFDGDGCISSSGPRWRFSLTSSSFYFLERCGQYIEDILDVNTGIYCKGDSAYSLEVCGNQQIQDVMDWLYRGVTICLRRKYERYFQLREERQYVSML